MCKSRTQQKDVVVPKRQASGVFDTDLAIVGSGKARMSEDLGGDEDDLGGGESKGAGGAAGRGQSDSALAHRGKELLMGALAMEISRPTDFKHVSSVRFDDQRARFVPSRGSTDEGARLIAEWGPDINKQFGVPMVNVPRMELPGYAERVPAVLVMMADYLRSNGGLDVPGIFRLAPEGGEKDTAKAEINAGRFEGCRDVNTIAHLIKVWFRELPPNLLDGVDKQALVEVAEAAGGNLASGGAASTQVAREVMTNVARAVPEPCLSVFLWLLDLMAEIVANEPVNRMTAENMAIVLSPNLFTVSTENPMAGMEWTRKVTKFTSTALRARILLRDPRAAIL